jgi:2-isopropylmalate synthase
MSKERLYIFDTTLRDGAQTQGVDFSVDDKVKVASALDNLGVDYIEGGWPGANPTDTEFFQRKHIFINERIKLMEKARENKDYVESDRIRKDLLDIGIEIENKGGKTTWKLK